MTPRSKSCLQDWRIGNGSQPIDRVFSITSWLSSWRKDVLHSLRFFYELFRVNETPCRPSERAVFLLAYR